MSPKLKLVMKKLGWSVVVMLAALLMTVGISLFVKWLVILGGGVSLTIIFGSTFIGIGVFAYRNYPWTRT